MLFRLLVAAAEQSRHLEVPAAERAIGGSLLEGGIEPQHRFQLVLDVAAILQPLAQAERLGERAHVGGDPEVPLGLVRRDARSRRAPAAMPASRYAFRDFLRRVRAEPVARARQLPRRLEVLRVLREPLGPDPFGLLRAGDVLALLVERIGIRRLRRSNASISGIAREQQREREHRVGDMPGPADAALQLARDQAVAEERRSSRRRAASSTNSSHGRPARGRRPIASSA